MKQRIIFILFVLTFGFMIFIGCNTDVSNPTPPPLPNGTASAAEPDQPVANTPGTPTPDKSKNSPFTLVVKNAILFDAKTDPFTRNLSREKGICLLVVGSVRNETNRIFHRGGLFGTLTATFSDSVTIKKHTSDLGFLPEVSSEEPWRPGTWRNFRLVTRSLDPIYIEYTPENVSAEIVVEVRDPLKFKQRKTLAEFSVPWRSLLGSEVSGAAAVLEQITPISFERIGARRFQPGDLVTLVAQKGAGYKVLVGNENVGWVPFRVLAIDLDDFKILPKTSLPKSIEADSIKMTLEELNRSEVRNKDEITYSAKLRIENGQEKSPLSVRAVDLLIDFGPGDAPSGTLAIKSEDGFKTTSGTTLKPGESQTFRFKVRAKKNQHPIELIWWAPSKIRLAVSLL